MTNHVSPSLKDICTQDATSVLEVSSYPLKIAQVSHGDHVLEEVVLRNLELTPVRSDRELLNLAL